MSQTYCGKNCECCGYLSRGECEGCAAVWRECEIANCCREKGHGDCTTCNFQNSCLKLKKKDYAPEKRAQNREWERKRQAAQAAKEAEFIRRAPFFGKWLWVLFCLSVFMVALGFLTTDSMADWFPAIQQPVKLLEKVCSLIYGVVLLKLASEEESYRVAGLCGIAVAVIGLFLYEIPGLGMIAQLAAAVVALVGNYQEYMAHAAVTAEVDYDLSEKWKKLWTYYLLAIGALFLSILLMFIVIGIFLALAASVAVLVIGILEMVYLYRTAKLFRAYPA